MEEIRLGVVGTGSIVHWVLDGVLATRGVSLAAVCSRSRERGETLSGQYGGERVYTELAEMLADREVNVVYVATPNLLHAEMTRRALEAGKHVWCEKPFCTRADQAEELFALAEERGLFLYETVPSAFNPNLAVVRRELPGLGRIRLVTSNYSQYSSRYDKFRAGELPNIFNPALAGGSLMDINFYNVYLSVALFGEPTEVHYEPNLRETQAGVVDTSGVLTLRYPDFVAACVGAKDTWGDNFFQIEGEEGYLRGDGPGGLDVIRVVKREGEKTYDLRNRPTRWYDEVAALVPLFLSEDRTAYESHKAATIATVRTMERARTGAGIRFPGDR